MPSGRSRALLPTFAHLLGGNVKTPTTLLVGDEDYRTPLSESEQFYRALKLRGVETPGGASRTPARHRRLPPQPDAGKGSG